VLAHYQKVLADEAEAFYLILRRVPVPKDFASLSLKELWELHQQGMEFLREVEEQTSAASPSLLDLKVEIVSRILQSCHLCERRCHKDRSRGEKGYCGVEVSRFSTDFLHMGEEPELIPSHTIFFTGCTFRCVYCQNWDIAMHPESGRVAEPDYLAKVVEAGKIGGSKNVNFVGGNPDPHLYIILKTVQKLQVNLPLIWNSNMFTSKEAMEILHGLIDLYLGDFRYGSDECARRFSDVTNYWAVVSRNFQLASEQGDVILRHLVLPGHLRCCTEPIMKWVAKNIPDVYFNLMFQYYPSYRASLFPEIDRRLSSEEKRAAWEMANEYGLNVSS
jgi:putative pyruvate formate lyase activating enzyme